MPAMNPAIVAHLGAMPWDDFRARVESIESPELRRAALRYRFATDRASFLKYCFPALFNRGFNRYHRAALSRPKVPVRDRKGRNVYRADAAPRGIAKTTLVKGEAAHDIVNELEEYIVVVSREMRLAVEITTHLHAMFTDESTPLWKLYGPFKVEGGVTSFSVTLPSGYRTAVLARSYGTQIRGANDRGRRPTKIIVDDGEHPKRVLNPNLRREDWQFLQDDILGCGPVDGGLVVEFRGTILHRDATLSNLIKDGSGWQGSLWKACEAWPERRDLWRECEALYRDLSLGDEDTRYAVARAFYEANREEMHRGARMLDEAAFGLFQFYMEIWQKGIRSVLRERQNEPDAPGTRYFDSEKFARCRVVGDKRTGGYLLTDVDLDPNGRRRIPLEQVRTFARLDPIPGKELGGLGEDGGAGASDNAALVILGRCPSGGGYVLDAWCKRARDSEQLAALWLYGEKWAIEKATIESNGFQRLLGREFRRQQEERKRNGEFYAVAVEDDVSTEVKENRIATLEGPISSRFLQFDESIPPEMLAEADPFPNGDHDDFLDATEGAWRLSNSVRVGMVNRPFQQAA